MAYICSVETHSADNICFKLNILLHPMECITYFINGWLDHMKYSRVQSIAEYCAFDIFMLYYVHRFWYLLFVYIDLCSVCMCIICFDRNVTLIIFFVSILSFSYNVLNAITVAALFAFDQSCCSFCFRPKFFFIFIVFVYKFLYFYVTLQLCIFAHKIHS